MTNPTEAPMANAIDDVKLLNCPFCGVMPFADVQNGQSGPLGQVQFVWCEKCDGCGPERLSKAEAIAAWNLRASPAPSQHTGWSDEAGKFTAAVVGHWQSDEGTEMANRYVAKTRDDLAYAQRTDFELANDIYMVSRNDLELLALQTAAKERIRWLSAQLAALTAASPIAPATGFEGEEQTVYGVPLSVKLAAVKEYVRVAKSCQPAAMHAALQVCLPLYGPSKVINNAKFLIERLEDFERGGLGEGIEDACRDFHGHVLPAIERLRVNLLGYSDIPPEADVSLNWERVADGFSAQIAKTKWGTYHVWIGYGDRWFWALNNERYTDTSEDGEAKAKAAAQAHFDAAIRSSISPSVAKESGEP